MRHLLSLGSKSLSVSSFSIRHDDDCWDMPLTRSTRFVGFLRLNITLLTQRRETHLSYLTFEKIIRIWNLIGDMRISWFCLVTLIFEKVFKKIQKVKSDIPVCCCVFKSQYGKVWWTRFHLTFNTTRIVNDESYPGRFKFSTRWFSNRYFVWIFYIY